jgi:hypothetical protein
MHMGRPSLSNHLSAQEFNYQITGSIVTKFKRSEFKLKQLGEFNFWFVSVQQNHQISHKSNFTVFKK